MEFKNTKHYY